MKTNIYKCERCGEDHKDLPIKKLTNSIEIANMNGYKLDHWAMCPNLNEPILIILFDSTMQ